MFILIHKNKKILFLFLLLWLSTTTSCGPKITPWPVAINDHLDIATSTVTPISTTFTKTPLSQENGNIQFSGYEWTIRESGMSGPGPNVWSRNNAWLDDIGDLHLKISHTANGWQCAELTTTERLGFGIYQFQIVGQIDQLDPNVVLGLFNYPTPEIGSDATNEIDIEYAQWGNAEWPIGNFTVWPAQSGIAPTSETYPVDLNGTYTTQRFKWESNQILFQALHGHRDDNEEEIKSWLYKPGEPLVYIPQQAMPLHINLWLFEGHEPLDGNEVEIVIHSFTFIPLGE